MRGVNNEKIISLAAGAVTIACTIAGTLAIPVSAAPEEKLPFELTAPRNVSITYLNENDSLNTCEAHYSQNNSMSEWASRAAAEETYDDTKKELQKLGYDDLWITAQIDWSIDSLDDWHYNKYWDTEGYDENFKPMLGEWAFIGENYTNEISMSSWIFRYMGNIDDTEDARWYGMHNDDINYDGWKDVLKEEQYDVVKTDDGSFAKIDLTKHTINIRVRWLVTCRPNSDGTEDFKVASEWSETAAVGKDAESFEPIKAGEIDPPVISELKYTDTESNGFPVISINLEVDDKLANQLAQATGTLGSIFFEAEASLAGKEEWVTLQGDFTIKSGEMYISLQSLAEALGKVEKDTPIELRARYFCTQTEQDDIYSDYSEILTFGSTEMDATPESVVESSTENSAEPSAESSVESTDKKEASTVQKAEEQEDKCSLCGFCPHPLGLCIFIWIAIIVAVVVIVVVIIVVMKKKSKSDKNNS